MSKRKTEKDYHELAKCRGFKWVGELLPKNVMIKTWWKCKKRHQWKASYDNIRQGRGCPFCSGKMRKIEKDYHELAKSRGFKWVGVFPKTAQYKTWWECDKGHRWKQAYRVIYNGNGCPYCACQVKKLKKDYHELAKSRSFKWIGEVLPKDTNTKTWWKCEKGHEWKTTYGHIRSCIGCPYCSGNAKKTKADYSGLAKKYGFEWFGHTLPKNNSIKTWWKCKNDHVWKTTYSKVQQGQRCPHCKNMINGVLTSKPQIKLNSLLCGSLNYPEGRYRIDVAIMRRSQKIAVEYDCQYWHKGREEQDAKRDMFLVSRGWKILHIKSNTLLPSKKQIKNIVINSLVETNNCIYNLYLEDWKH